MGGITAYLKIPCASESVDGETVRMTRQEDATQPTISLNKGHYSCVNTAQQRCIPFCQQPFPTRELTR